MGPVVAFAQKSESILIEDYERADSAISDSSANDAIKRLANDANGAGLRLIVDVTLDRVAATGEVAQAWPNLFFRSSHADTIERPFTRAICLPSWAQRATGGGRG